MNDDEIEALLRRVRPASPRPELRARIAATQHVQRTWPWSLAAAALLVLTVSAHFSATRIYEETARAVATPDRRVNLETLAAAAGEDEWLRQQIEALADEEQRRAAREESQAR